MRPLAELLQEHYSCQLCGSQLRWDEIEVHQRVYCKNKNPMTHPNYSTAKIPGLPRSGDLTSGLPKSHPAQPNLPQKNNSHQPWSPAGLHIRKNPYLKTESFVLSAFAASKEQPKGAKVQYGNLLDEEAFTGNCLYCGVELQSEEHMECHMCDDNPRCRGYCAYCGTNFRGTLEMPASLMVIYHEERCRSNPVNKCEYCGYVSAVVDFWLSQSYTCTMNEPCRLIRGQLSSHRRICAANPRNSAQCRFCSREFSADFLGSAKQRCNGHMRNCNMNPENWCFDCGMVFNGIPDGTREDTAKFRQARHHCINSEPVTEAEAIISQIHKRLKTVTSTKRLRLELRRLQLAWHPDKNPSRQETALEVFQYIQMIWDAHFK